MGMDASNQGSRVAANGVITRDSTNAAIVIAILPLRKSADSPPVEIREAYEIVRWLTSAGAVPERNLRLITSEVIPNRDVMGPEPQEIETAFRALYAARAEGRPSNTLVRNRLYIVAIGPGWGDRAGLVTLLTPNQIGVELTGLADQFRDERLFDEVVLIADVPRLPGHTGTSTPIRLASGLPREPSEPAEHFYAFSNRFGPRQTAHTEKRFTPILLEGLAGKAKDASGIVDAYSLGQFIEREYAQEKDPRLHPEFRLGSGPPLLFFRPPLAGEAAILEGSDAVAGEADRHIQPAPDDVPIEPGTGDLSIESEAPSNAIDPGAAAAAIGLRGGGLKFAREAGEDELCLNVDDYASALAQLYASADDGEFCLAVFGPWGRGKTFLMRRVDVALSALGHGYRTIRFSAWKYPNAPEVWVYLYEQFAKAAFEGPWYQVMPNVIRAGIAKNGTGPLLWAYAMLAFGLIPLGTLFAAAHVVLATLYPIVGVIGFVLLVTLITGIKRTKSRLNSDYLTGRRHSEKLGLQATIGADLRALLIGWVPIHLLGRGFSIGYGLVSAALIAALTLRFAQGPEIAALAKEYFGWTLVGGPVVGIQVAFTTGIATLLLAILIWIHRGGDSPRRVLLVVDDLDRCKPEHLLSVMESVKLLIEDRDISRRVQVAMLLEEDILKHAIFRKYGHLIEEKRAKLLRTQYDADRLMWENGEKFFTAHLRLPVLSKGELRDLIETFSRRKIDEAEEQRKRAARKQRIEEELERERTREPLTHVQTGIKESQVETGPVFRGQRWAAETVREPQYRPATADEIQADRERAEARLRQLETELGTLQTNPTAPASPPLAVPTPTVSQKVLEKSEVDAILAALDTQTTTRTVLGPRAIRAFIFRYQLARLLLETLKIDWSADELSNALARKSFGSPSPTVQPVSADLTDKEKLERVVDQVC
jgi:hypothetical protein